MATGDWGLVSSFARVVRDLDAAPTNARESLESQLLALAAEQARLEDTIVEMDTFRRG